jgi:mono/diheme cytochrome c family protein
MDERMKKGIPVLALFLIVGLTARAKVQTQSSSSGADHFERLCAGCHGSDGRAIEGEAPPLAESSWVAGPESRLIRIVMHGVKGPIEVGGAVYDREMPGFGTRLSDEEMALLLSLLRGRWGGPGAPITPESVRRVRAAEGNRTRYWTVEELLKLRD